MKDLEILVIYQRIQIRILLFILMLPISLAAYSTAYYISTSGNDANNGTSVSTPWQSLAKLNSIILKPGDQVLFKRGDTFYGVVTIKSNGSVGNPITYGAYGTGVNPVITGFKSVTNWVNKGNNIWESVEAVSTLPTLNMVTINGLNSPTGRYPNSNAVNGGYLTYQTHLGKTAITSSEIAGTPNWTGAKAIIRTQRYLMTFGEITSHSTNTLNFSTPLQFEPLNGYGFFIQDDIRTLDVPGEWYYNPSSHKISIYSTLEPINVKVSTIENLLTYSGSNNVAIGNYTAIQNIDFVGSNGDAIYVWKHWWTQLHHISVSNCNLNLIGGHGIYLQGNYVSLTSNSISNTNKTAINLEGCEIINIENNTLRNIALTLGKGNGFGDCAIAAFGIKSANIKYNKLTNCGFNGISFDSDSISVLAYNLIDTYNVNLDDGGAITTNGGNLYGNEIVGNICINGKGNYFGTPHVGGMSVGIYLDDSSYNISVENNTVANNAWFGFYLHNSKYINIRNNLSYNNAYQIYIRDDINVGVVEKNILDNNIFICRSSKQMCSLYSTVYNNLLTFGTFSNNIYAKPISEKSTILYGQLSTGAITSNLSGWQSFSGQDLNSKNSNLTIADEINDFQFEYNATNATKTVALSSPMIDMKGRKYYDKVTLDPFSSVVFIKDTNPVEPVIPVWSSSVVNNSSPNVIEINYTEILANILPSTSSYSVQVNSVEQTIKSIAISGTKVLLTLSTPIVYGDTITIQYTKPSINPIQTTSGGLAATISRRQVQNSVNAVVEPVIPVWSYSIVNNSSPNNIEINYTQSLANILPATSSFSVHVNSVERTVTSIAISGTKVMLTLSSPIVYGDIISIVYIKPSVNPIQTSSGGLAATISRRLVQNSVIASVEPVIPVWSSSVVYNSSPNVIEINYTESLANIVPSTSSYSVQVNSAERTVNSIAISGTKVLLTLPIPIVYGDIVTIVYSKPSINPIQTSSGGLAATISRRQVQNSVIAPVEPVIPVWSSSVVNNSSPNVIEINYTESLANILPSTSSYSVHVNSVERTVTSIAISGTKVLLTLSSPIAYGDTITIVYSKPLENPIQTPSGGFAATISRRLVHNAIIKPVEPVIPVWSYSIVNNSLPNVIEIIYTESLATILPSLSSYSVQVNSVERAVKSITISGTKVLLTLSSPIIYGDIITIVYTKPSVNPIQTPSGGLAATISRRLVHNALIAPVEPIIPVWSYSIVNNSSPSLIEIYYTESLANILPTMSTFSVQVNSIERPLKSIAISGTKVLLTLSSPIVYGDIITIVYTKPSVNPIQTPSGGLAATISKRLVHNSVIALKKGTIATHFNPVWQGESEINNVNVKVIFASIDGQPLSTDDEIALFSGSNCVGSIKLANSIDSSSVNILPTILASATDGSNNGFTENDTILIKVWDNKNQKEMKANAVYYKNNNSNWLTSGKYIAGSTSVVEIISYTDYFQTTDIKKGNQYFQDIVTVDIYPNPSKGQITVRFSSLPQSGSRIDIFDIAGRKIQSRLIYEIQESFNLMQPAGIYLMKSVINSKESIQKLIIN